MSGANSLAVVIACDCDPDRPDFGGTRYDNRDKLVWRGVAEGIPALVEALEGWANEQGIRRPPITWCVRSDLQMQDIYGDCAWPYRQFETLWRQLESSGDEIAWHPHLWRWSDAHGCWYQETEDDEWIVQCLERGYEALCKAYGGRIITSRMGWEFHNNVTMRKIDELGIRVDMSAVPGRRREAKSDRGSMKHGELDWEITGQEPYHPSREDYRRPAVDGANALDVMEVPRAACSSRLWGVVRKAWRATTALRRGDLHWLMCLSDGAGYVHAPALTAPPRTFGRLLRRYGGVAEARTPFLTAFHSDEVLVASGQPYSADNLQSNLRQLARATSGRGGPQPQLVCARGSIPICW